MAQDAAVQSVLNQMLWEINQAHGRWNGFFHGLSAAYADAYDSQERILGRVKETIEARQKQREAQISFILSLVTVGLGGPKVSGFLNDLSDVTKDLVAGQKILSTLWERRDGIGSALKDLDKADPMISNWISSISGVGSGGASESAFKPAVVSPAKFGAKLLQHAQERTNLMVRIVMDLMTYAAAPVTQQQANTMLVGQRQSWFIKDAPPDQMTIGVMRNLDRQTRIALWVGWAQLRDLNYWTQETNNLHDPVKKASGTEFWDWEALAVELTALGLGRFVIGEAYFNSNSFKPELKERKGVLFPLFIQWSFSLAALDEIFRTAHPDPIGFAIARNEWVRRNVFGQ